MAEIEELIALEHSLWRAETRFDQDHMDRALADDFVEFGRSGRVYTKATLPMERQALEARLSDMAVAEVAPDVRLVTYVSEVRTAEGVQRANRSSLWVRAGASWRLRFSQGTPA